MVRTTLVTMIGNFYMVGNFHLGIWPRMGNQKGFLSVLLLFYLFILFSGTDTELESPAHPYPLSTNPLPFKTSPIPICSQAPPFLSPPFTAGPEMSRAESRFRSVTEEEVGRGPKEVRGVEMGIRAL